MAGTSTALCQALGTTWWLELPTTLSTADRTAIESDIIAYIAQFEADFSRFQSTSFVSQLNRTGTLLNPTPRVQEVLTYGQKLFVYTGGVFNLLIGTHLSKRGYDSAYSFTPLAEPAAPPNPTTDLHITPDRITLAQGSVDIGGYGKGYLIDLLRARLEEKYELPSFLINGGGDMYAKTTAAESIAIYLAHPQNPQLVLAQTTLKNEAFAASSPHLRRWTHEDTTYDHLIRPTDTSQTESVDGTFTKAPTAAAADALATTLLLQDLTAAQDFCHTHQLAAAFYHTSQASLVATPAFTPLTLV